MKKSNRENNKSGSLERVAEEGGFVNLVKAIGEDSPEILTKTLGVAVGSILGTIAGEAAMAGTRIIHAAMKGQAWKQIASEFMKLKESGKISEDFVETDLGKACLLELLEAVDRSPDPQRIRVIKNAFLRIAADPGSANDAAIQQQLLHLIGTLSSGEIILLASAFRVGGSNQYPNADKWLNDMAHETGFREEGLVEMAEIPLMEKRLIHPRTFADKSGVKWGQRNRLTSLGERVCRLMMYENV